MKLAAYIYPASHELHGKVICVLPATHRCKVLNKACKRIFGTKEELPGKVATLKGDAATRYSESLAANCLYSR
ncbi:hypothetical protein Plim_4297 (plasmid) [Planctopirus limnophila DSM 3776]|uniref:Uncharacterized protein n=1 Tax=Planctopirus limnophila (strain ATCC 43296 / DSM 3776 / IFAM 1008 / Mu 290) TaxID=521674 RepID=D5SZI4_PLAL2|nr:hypothetical protein [Planctopirus limnophila]ADG70104.1 hypothetical protein Plim_4297 [Planctopirus limnophila DSM 3776]